MIGMSLAVALAMAAGWQAAAGAAPGEKQTAAADDPQTAMAQGSAQSVQVRSAQTETLDFSYPRLGMWWPDPWEQPIGEIARYDWVILGDWLTEFITPLKAINPDMLLLNSTNACELGFNGAENAEPWENEEVRRIPPEWFLTQVGTTLTQAVDAVTTTFHVAAITVTDGSTVYPLFVVSDTVLIEGESVFIEAVDAGARTLTVRRGFVRPAGAHNAGTRVAAHISFWPNTWVLNLSLMSPTATVSSAFGAERWGDYNARVAVALLADERWDGLLIDRSDSNQSWLIGNSTARTIDPDQSNTLLSDYSAFDASWNAGLRLYEQKIRQMVGDGRILFVNWGMPNYDLLNGNNYEGEPQKDTDWRNLVFGPFPKGSYFDWMKNARQPNLTMIETYEDDGGPSPVGDGSYENPCTKAGFTPNYRKMRFGLVTTLMNDGFFSYEINTNGHGSLCLMWFDEYDNAGKGRGYLGKPKGDAYRVADIPLGENRIASGGFESEAALARWTFWPDTEHGYSGTVSLDVSRKHTGNASARIDSIRAAGTGWQISFSFEPVKAVSGTDYTVSFWARADRQRPLDVWVQQNEDPWETYLWFDEIPPLTTTWQYYELSGTAVGGNQHPALFFGTGQVTGTVWLDDVQYRQGSREVWRRDYDGGIVLVNASAHPKTVLLGDYYRKITGTQAPDVNDGGLVDHVVLPARDGLILLAFRNKVLFPLVASSTGLGPR